MRVRRRTATAALTAAGLALTGFGSGATADAAPAAPASVTTAKPDPGVQATKRIRQNVRPENVEAHMRAFQEIADDHDGNRAAGTPGYEQSARYVEAVLRKAGYRTQRQFFDFVYEKVEASSLAVTAPQARTVANGPMSYSPGTPKGGVTAALVAPAAIQGCDAAAWSSVDAKGKIALVQRGTCSFGQKSKAAKAAGAAATIIYNNADGELNGTLGEVSNDFSPTTAITRAEGAALVAAMADGPVTMKFDLQKVVEKRRTFNVIAETKAGRADNVVMLGSHLDGVQTGPGINDNGSGSAGVLETAVQMAKQKKITNKVRFAWWGGEELGLLGSTHYIDTMKANDPAGLTKIATYLNFDMIGSPNYIVGVYDADQSTYEAPVAVPQGSIETESVFTDYFDGVKQPWIDTEFSGRSDYQAFIQNGIPASGLFSGADGRKSKAEVMLFGGKAGVDYDANYHTAKDNLDNVNMQAVDIMSDAIAHATLSLANSTKAVNGR